MLLLSWFVKGISVSVYYTGLPMVFILNIRVWLYSANSRWWVCISKRGVVKFLKIDVTLKAARCRQYLPSGTQLSDADLLSQDDMTWKHTADLVKTYWDWKQTYGSLFVWVWPAQNPDVNIDIQKCWGHPNLSTISKVDSFQKCYINNIMYSIFKSKRDLHIPPFPSF